MTKRQGCGVTTTSQAVFPPAVLKHRPFLRDADADRLVSQGLARRVIADVLVAFDAPDSREVRAAAVGLLIPARPAADPGWVVGFQSAAWLYTGSATMPAESPSELHVIIPPGQRRPRTRGLRGRQVALERDQVAFVGAVAVTDPVRTAADVARDLPAAEALTVLRRLGELSGVRPHQVISLLSTMRYARGAATARRLVRRWEEEP
jgi:hypothetical protein